MILEAQALSVAATLDGRRVAALRDLDLALAPGRILGVVGESGAGKSMLARAIAGALPAGFAVTGGALRYRGQDLAGMAPGRRRGLLGREIAFIPQEPMAALNPVRTVGAQLGEHLRRLRVADRRERALALLGSVQLRDPAALLGRYPHQLSGGMCQRVLIAMAFASDPALVVADEPTTALDVTVQAQIIRLLRQMQARAGTAVVFITHDLLLASRLCDDVLVLYAGRPVERGPAARVLADPAHPYTRCLVLAAPTTGGARRALFALPGQMPGLRELAAAEGCRFAPRCPVAQPDCAHAEPAMGDGAACWHRDRTGAIAVGAAGPAPAGADAAELLRVEGLRRVFATRRWFVARRVVAVADAAFSIARGEFVGVVGESGSGKTTLARLVIGLERASAGRILLDGVALPAAASAARVRRLAAMQMVFQDPQSALNPRRTVADIVTQRLRAAGARAWVRQARAAALLAMVGLAPELAGRYPAQLSGGQRQRVNIARALCIVPRLLVADEIVSGLDVSVQAQLLDLLLRLRAELGFAMLFISHDLAVVRYLCSAVLVMQDGVIVERGATAEVFAAPRHAYTRLLLASASDASPCWV